MTPLLYPDHMRPIVQHGEPAQAHQSEDAMNNTTKAQREQWIARALQLIKMDNSTAVINSREVQEKLIKEFGISRDSAMTAIAACARRVRGVIIQ